MAYVRKTRDEYEVQGCYCGEWDVLTTEDNYYRAKKTLKSYDENEKNYPHRIVKKRVKIA